MLSYMLNKIKKVVSVSFGQYGAKIPVSFRSVLVEINPFWPKKMLISIYTYVKKIYKVWREKKTPFLILAVSNKLRPYT